MARPLSINEALDRLDELADTDICVRGILCFAFENRCLVHLPYAERRGGYSSSIWIEVGAGALQFDRRVCESLGGKRVIVEGTLIRPDPIFGGGHMGLWPAEIVARTLRRE